MWARVMICMPRVKTLAKGGMEGRSSEAVAATFDGWMDGPIANSTGPGQ